MRSVPLLLVVLLLVGCGGGLGADSQVFVVGSDGGHAHQLTRSEGHGSLSWSPDGKKLAYVPSPSARLTSRASWLRTDPPGPLLAAPPRRNGIRAGRRTAVASCSSGSRRRTAPSRWPRSRAPEAYRARCSPVSRRSKPTGPPT